MAYVYERDAVDCPGIQVCPDDLSLFADPPLPRTFDAVIEGATGTQQMRAKLNRNAVRAELIGRHGAGAVGILTGLELSASGSTITVGAGKANVSGPVELAADTTLAATDNVDNFVWISEGGTLNKRTSADGDPHAAPDTDTNWAYLGMVPMVSGVPGDIDLSGVFYVSGGVPRRQTADATVPADTPPGNVAFLHTGASQTWFWNGFRYQEPTAETHTVIAEGGDVAPGALDAKTIAGAGIGLAVVTDTGVRKLQVTNTDRGSAVVLAGDVTGPAGTNVVEQIQGVPAEAPVSPGDDGRIYQFDGTQFALVDNGPDHLETFTIHTEVELGSIGKFRVDFSARGAFGADYLAVCVPDQEGVSVSVLDNDRDPDGFWFELSVANDAASGTYYGADAQELVWTLSGYQWTAGVTPSADPTVTEDSYDFSDLGPVSLSPGQETIITDSVLSATVGSHIVDTETAGADVQVTLPPDPVAGERHTITRFGASHDVNIIPNTDQLMYLGSTITLTETQESITLEWWPSDDPGLWNVIAYVNSTFGPGHA